MRCSWCGLDYTGSAPVCPWCNTEFKEGDAVKEAQAPCPAPPRRSKLLMLATAWTVAVLSLGPISWGVVVLFFRGSRVDAVKALLMFPAGLGSYIQTQHPGHLNLNAMILVEWLAYVVIVAGAYLSRRRLWFTLLYVLLCAMLAVNVLGCYKAFVKAL